MCRMTDSKVRAIPAIDFPGLYYVSQGNHTGRELYLNKRDPVYNPLYAIRVRLKHPEVTKPIPKYSRESMQGQNYHRPEWADLYRA